MRISSSMIVVAMILIAAGLGVFVLSADTAALEQPAESVLVEPQGEVILQPQVGRIPSVADREEIPNKVDRTLNVSVRSTTGSIVEGVNLDLFAGQARLSCRSLNPEPGQHSLEITAPEELRSATLYVSAKGYAHESAEVELPSSGDGALVEVVMEPGVRISGRVVLESGEPPPVPVRVIAWSEDGVDFVRSRISLSGTCEALAAATTDAEGAFEISGVKRELAYTLTCGARGWVAKHSVSIPSTEVPARLVLWKMMGALVRLRDQDGRDVAKSTFSRRGVEFGHASGAVNVSRDDFDVVLAGMEQLLTDPRCADWRALCLVKSHGEPDVVRSLAYTYGIPGYKTAEVKLPVKHLSSDRMPVVTARLHRLVAGFGDVTLRLVGEVVPRKTPTFMGGAALRLSFSSPDASNKFSFKRNISNLHRDRLTFRGIPEGYYEAEITGPASSGSGSTVLAAWSIRVPPDGTAVEMPFDTASLGSLDIDVRYGHGRSRYNHYVRVDLERDDGWSAQFALSGRPYRIDGLPPGRYRVQASGSSPANNSGDDLVARGEGVVMAAMQITSMTMAWERIAK